MRTLVAADGRYGTIVVKESIKTGDRSYFEGTTFQSQAHPDGYSCFPYVHIMKKLLAYKQRSVLLLGCGAGSLATMLCRKGIAVTVVDNNPMSFKIARDYFWLPDEVECITDDFRDFLLRTENIYAAIGIDVGNDFFDFKEEFDRATCILIQRSLEPKGIVAINMLSEHDVDRTADIIGSYLADERRSAWILDEMGIANRNAIVVATTAGKPHIAPEVFCDSIRDEIGCWSVRAPRITANTIPSLFPNRR
jgi:SAM-dependent methyltransferase